MSSERQSLQPIVLSIAGFDPSGGAGIIADVKTLVSFGSRPAAAITSLTFQNSAGVFGAIHESAASLRAQILPIAEEFRIAAVKIGMLPTRELVLEVARLLSDLNMPAPVLDPVLRSSSGYELVEEGTSGVVLSVLMPLARVITPNIPEAESFTGLRIEDEDGMRLAARKLREFGARAVLVKGGHLQQGLAGDPGQAIDLLDDNGQVTVFRDEWIDSPPVRGTGCMLSAAIAACLAQAATLQDSVSTAKQFVAEAITLELTESGRSER